MSEQRFSFVYAWIRRATFKRELIQRDPLWKALIDCLSKIVLDNPAPEACDTLVEKSRELRSQLAKKYGMSRVYLVHPGKEELQARRLSPNPVRATLRWEPLPLLETPIRLQRNWLPSEFGPTSDLMIVRDESDLFRTGRQEVFFSAAPEDPCPTLTITVNLAEVTHRDLERLASEFKYHVGQELRARPRRSRRESRPLDFLRTVTEEQFYQDLRRYDLHITEGLTFRKIAFTESLEKRGKSHDDQFRSRPLRVNTRGESAVRESVARIYRAIHRKAYKARRRRLDSPAEGVEEYHCPEHDPRYNYLWCDHPACNPLWREGGDRLRCEYLI
jgi:hypothetical protein